MNDTAVRPIRNNKPSDTRVPPHNIEAEESVLGSALISAKALELLIGRVHVRWFYRESHATVWEAISTLHAQGKPVDAITTAAELRHAGTLESVGGTPFIHTLVAGVPTAANAEHYARIVEEHALLRELIEGAQSVIERASESPENLPEVLSFARRLFSDDVGHRRATDRLMSGDAFLSEHAEQTPTAWGKADEILWAVGEPLMIVGPTGVGKTTIAQQLILGRIGVFADDLLGYSIARDERPALYIAADRPRQAARSLRRMIGEAHVPLLKERLIVHRGPLEFDVGAHPDRFASFVRSLGVGTVVIDSLKDVALNITKEEPAGGVARAMQLLVSDGIDVVILHHQRKASGENRKPTKIDDVYGGMQIPATAGSVLCVWGAPGDPIVELSQIKQPASECGPFQVIVDHENGRVEIDESSGIVEIVRAADGGVTAAEVARQVFGGTAARDIEKARRRLERLVGLKRLHALGGGRGRGAARTYFVIDREVPEPDATLEENHE